MKKFLCGISLMLIISTTYAQKIITIESGAQTVPAGKKWVLALNKPILLATDPGALKSGTACNAQLLSKSAGISGIIIGDNLYRPDKIYTVKFTGLRSSGLNGNNVLEITPTSFVAFNYNSQSFEKVTGNLTFYAGQQLSAFACLVSIQAMEYNMTADDKASQQRIAKSKADADLFAQKESEQNAARYKQQEIEELKDKVANGIPVSYFDLKNSPRFIPSDTNHIHEDIISVFKSMEPKGFIYYGQNRQWPNFTVDVDTAGKIIKIRNVDIDKSFGVDENQLLGLMNRHFKINEPGYVVINGREKKAAFNIMVKLDVARKEAITSQITKIIKKEDHKFEVSFTTDPRGTGYQNSSFRDDSYLPVMTAYVLGLPKAKMKALNGERLLARNYQLVVRMMFQFEDYTFRAVQDNWEVARALSRP